LNAAKRTLELAFFAEEKIELKKRERKATSWVEENISLQGRNRRIKSFFISGRVDGDGKKPTKEPFFSICCFADFCLAQRVESEVELRVDCR
jgi:hypothetical protein